MVAAGAWVGRLLPSYPAPDSVAARADDHQKTGDGLYLVPPVEGRGFKVGDHAFSRSGDPRQPRRQRRDRAAARALPHLFKGFERWRIDRLKACSTP